MENTLVRAKRSKSQDRQEQGFTLLEVLTVTAIVGVLSATALPIFQSYKGRAFDTEALTTLRSAAVGEEDYFVENETYISCDQSNCHLFLPNLKEVPPGIELQIVATGTEFTGTARHIKGTGKVYTW